MLPATRTPEGEPNRCPICGKAVVIGPSVPTRDAPCPHCGSLLWFPEPAGLPNIGFPVYTCTIAPESKEQAIRMIVDGLIESGKIRHEDGDCIVRAILKRESQGTTGIGRGVAIPHSKFSVDHVVGAVAKVPAGVDFESLDGKPVHVICLLVTPQARPGESLRALEAISRRLREGW